MGRDHNGSRKLMAPHAPHRDEHMTHTGTSHDPHRDEHLGLEGTLDHREKLDSIIPQSRSGDKSFSK